MELTYFIFFFIFFFNFLIFLNIETKEYNNYLKKRKKLLIGSSISYKRYINIYKNHFKFNNLILFISFLGTIIFLLLILIY